MPLTASCILLHYCLFFTRVGDFGKHVVLIGTACVLCVLLKRCYVISTCVFRLQCAKCWFYHK
jgi:hypothetical protein